MPHRVLDRRRAGLLVPVFALRRATDLGVGDTRAVVEALEFCAARGFTVLQLLPIQETIGDHSPYNPISSRALSPTLLTLEPDWVPGLSPGILAEAAPQDWLEELRRGKASHAAVAPLKDQLLHRAFDRFLDQGPANGRREFSEFCSEQADWLEPYCLHRLLIREYEGNQVWRDWRPEHRSPAGAKAWLARHPDRQQREKQRAGYAFIQWVAWRQWRRVRARADELGVRLMGEISHGVSLESSDVWAQPELFELDWSLGTPPLAHFDTGPEAAIWGQNWGLPPFAWDRHRATGFAWLRGRVAWQRQFFHAARVDHLRGYFRTYQFPWRGGAEHHEFAVLTEEQAALRTGGVLPRFVPGPDHDPQAAAANEALGRELIGVLIEAAGDMDLVAELMGEMPGYMRRTLEDLRLANLAFPQLLREETGRFLEPGRFRELSLATWANHDNAPLATLYLTLKSRIGAGPVATAVAEDPAAAAACLEDPAACDDEAVNAVRSRADLQALLDFAGFDRAAPEQLDDDLLLALQRALFSTCSRLAVLMISDLIGVPLRFNLPGSHGRGTWADRVELPLAALAEHPLYGPRIARAHAAAEEFGRTPQRNISAGG